MVFMVTVSILVLALTVLMPLLIRHNWYDNHLVMTMSSLSQLLLWFQSLNII